MTDAGHFGRFPGTIAKERRFVSDAQNAPDGVHSSVVESVPASATREDDAVLRARDDVQVVHEVSMTFFKNVSVLKRHARSTGK